MELRLKLQGLLIILTKLLFRAIAGVCNAVKLGSEGLVVLLKVGILGALLLDHLVHKRIKHTRIRVVQLAGMAGQLAEGLAMKTASLGLVAANASHVVIEN